MENKEPTNKDNLDDKKQNTEPAEKSNTETTNSNVENTEKQNNNKTACIIFIQAVLSIKECFYNNI